MSKVAMERPRYVAFRVEAQRPLSRRAVQAALRHAAGRAGLDPEAIQLTRFDWPNAIARVPHEALRKARAALGGIASASEGDARLAVRVTTLSTSGTLKALTARLGLLGERGERTPPRQG